MRPVDLFRQLADGLLPFGRQAGDLLRRGKAACGHSKPTEEFPTICVSHYASSTFWFLDPSPFAVVECGNRNPFRR